MVLLMLIQHWFRLHLTTTELIAVGELPLIATIFPQVISFYFKTSGESEIGVKDLQQKAVAASK
jgi:hypothetical protein